MEIDNAEYSAIGSLAGAVVFCVLISGVVGASAPATDAVDANESVRDDSLAEQPVTETYHVIGSQNDTGSAGAGSATASSQSIDLQFPAGFTRSPTGNNSWSVTQEPSIEFSQNITFDGGTDYNLVVTEEDTGGTVTITPPENLTIVPPAMNNSGGSPSDAFLAIFFRGGTGEVSPVASMAHARDFYSDLNLTTTGQASASGIVNQSVALVDAQSGATIAETGTRPFVLGYNGTIRSSVTSSSVEFSLPREPFPADADVELEVYNASLSGPGANNSPTVTASYDSQSDSFEGSLDKAKLDRGNYTYRLRVTHQSGIDFTFEAKHLNRTYENDPPIKIVNTTNQTPGTNQSISLYRRGVATTQTGTDSWSVTQEPTIEFSQNITFDGGNDYSLDITDENTGGVVTITPPSNLTIVPQATDASSGFLSIAFRVGGSVTPTAAMTHVSDSYPDLGVATTGTFSDSGIVNQSVALVDARSGATIAETGTRPFVLNYNETVTSSVTNSSVEFSLPREPFPADATVKLEVYNASLDYGNADKTVATATYNSQSDSFEASLAESKLDPGNYTYRLNVTHPNGISFDVDAADLDETYENDPPINISDRNTTTSITLPGASGPAQSIDSDPLLEDVDGDGSANVFDALALYNNRNEPVVQNNPQFFDFDGDGNINVFDAIELVNEIS